MCLWSDVIVMRSVAKTVTVKISFHFETHVHPFSLWSFLSDDVISHRFMLAC